MQTCMCRHVLTYIHANTHVQTYLHTYIHTCKHACADMYLHTYGSLHKSWQLVFGQQCGKIGNGVYNSESMHHVLAMFKSYKGTCAEVHTYFKHKYYSNDSFIQTWKSMKWKDLYIKI